MERICLVGGDARMEYATRALEAVGYRVASISRDEIEQACNQGDLVVGGGLPVGCGGLDYLQNEAFLFDNELIVEKLARVLLEKGKSSNKR